MNQEFQDYTPTPAYTGVDVKTRVNAFVQGVYLWMTGALAITGVVAYFVASNFNLLSLFISFERRGRMLYATGVTPGWWICAIVAFGLAMYFRTRLDRISVVTATMIYLAYSVLTGITLSPIFVVYVKTSIASVFFICAATFAATSVFGFVTKRNIAGILGFLSMGLIGIIIASLVNIVWLKSDALSMIIAYVGVIVFVGLSAYYTQRMKNMALTIPEDATSAVIRKATLDNALNLYLSFINLFIMLLRIFGQRN